MSYFRGLLSLFLACALTLSVPMSSLSQAQAQQDHKLQVRVVEGANRILRQNESLELVVEIREGQRPVAGAEVTFIAPEEGPGILFAGNTDRLTVKADARGRAASGRTRSIGGEGAFSVGIIAMVQGNTATTTTQAANPAQAPPATGNKTKSKKLLWILVGAAGAGAVAAFALKGGSDSDADDGGEPPTITVGPPTIGAPQ